MALQVFQEQEAEYFNWLKEHSDGLVLNTRSSLSPDYMVLHKASCKLVSGYSGKATPGAFTERSYRKVCADAIAPIKLWVEENDGTLSRCSYCDPDEDDLVAYYSNLYLRAKSSLDDDEGRRARLAKAPKTPQRILITTTVYLRNHDVVAEVLSRAKGKCERCGEDAPFRRATDGSPYLEVHHLVQLSQGGDDSVENAQAQCPNCHREAHLGVVA